MQAVKSSDVNLQILEIPHTVFRDFARFISLRMAIRSIYRLPETVTPFPHGLCQGLKDFLGVFPADACIGDADAVLETSFAFLRHLLRAFAGLAFTSCMRHVITHLR